MPIAWDKLVAPKWKPKPLLPELQPSRREMNIGWEKIIVDELGKLYYPSGEPLKCIICNFQCDSFEEVMHPVRVKDGWLCSHCISVEGVYRKYPEGYNQIQKEVFGCLYNGQK
jgi:hypothetical protein